MTARGLVLMGRITPRLSRGSRKPPLIPLDDALPAGGFQAAAELRGFVGRSERPHHGAVIDPFVAEIGTLDHRRARSEYRRELALQSPIGSLGVGLVLLRRDLNHVSAAACGRAWLALRRGGRDYPGTWFRGGGRVGAPRGRP